MRLDILERRTEVEQWVAEGKTKAFICKEFRCKPETLNDYLKKMGISYAGQPGHHGEETKKTRVHATTHMYLGSIVKSNLLKQKMLRDGLRKHVCEICGTSEWNGGSVPLELHHIDGDRFNNLNENLQLICPNCHALTPNNAGRNCKSAGTRKKYKKK